MRSADDMSEFPYEVWFEGQYVNAYTSLIAADAKAHLVGPGARVYEWIPERHVRIHRLLVQGERA